jgi:hypothetical protein
LVGIPNGKRPYGGRRLKWPNNIEMSPHEIGWDGVDWIDLVRDKDKRQGSGNGNKPSCSIKYGKFFD